MPVTKRSASHDLGSAGKAEARYIPNFARMSATGTRSLLTEADVGPDLAVDRDLAGGPSGQSDRDFTLPTLRDHSFAGGDKVAVSANDRDGVFGDGECVIAVLIKLLG